MSEEILIKDYEEKITNFVLITKSLVGQQMLKIKKGLYRIRKEELLDNFIEAPLDMINKIKVLHSLDTKQIMNFD